METVTLTEVPSESRRRLSRASCLSHHSVESAAQVVQRRRSSAAIISHPPPTSSTASRKCIHDGGIADDDDEDDDGKKDDHETNTTTTKTKTATSKRVSVQGKRASTFTKFFALSSTSQSFLERPALRPTLINAMIFFTDPNPDIENIRRLMKNRLLDIPRFRSTFRLLDDEDENGGKGSIHWDPVPRCDVDMTYHVTTIDGGEEFDDDDLEDLITRSYLSDWDTSRPLWKFTLVTNLKDGRSMLFCSIDHAIGDGVAMLQVMLSLLDDPNEEEADGRGNGNNLEGCSKKSFQKPRRQMTGKNNKANGKRWAHRLVDFVGGVRDGVISVLAPPDDLPNTLKIPRERLGQVSTGKEFVQTRAFDLEEIKSIKNRLEGTTVNDIIMAIHAVGFRRYYEEMNDPVLDILLSSDDNNKNGDDAGDGRKKRIQAEFPVNLRPPTESGEITDLGNTISMGTIPLPLNHDDPVDAVWKCKYEIDRLKHSPAFHVRKKLLDVLVNAAPAEVLAKKLDEEGIKSTCLLSNVMGPPQMSTMGGYLIDDLNFTASTNAGLYSGVLTYNGKLRVSLIRDKLTDGCARKLRDCLESAYDDLRDIVLGDDGDEDGCDGTVITREGRQYPLTQPPPARIPLSARIVEAICLSAALSLPVLASHCFRGHLETMFIAVMRYTS